MNVIWKRGLASCVLVTALGATTSLLVVRGKPPLKAAPLASTGARARTQAADEISRAEKALREGVIPLGISPDGARLLLQTQKEQGYTLGICARDRTLIGEIETGARPRLTTWSPSGDYISYAADRGGGEYGVHLWNVRSGLQLTPDAPLTQVVTQPKWSANGQRFTHVVEKKGGHRALYWVSIEPGSAARPLAPDITAKAGIAWAPSGERIATITQQAPRVITVLNLDGTERAVPVGEVAEIRDLAWSSDSKRLLFTSRARDAKLFSLAEVQLQNHQLRRFESAADGDVVQPFYLNEKRGFVYRVYPGDEKLVFSCARDGRGCSARGPATGQVTPWGTSARGDKLYLGQLLPRTVYEIDLASGAQSVVYAADASADFQSGGTRIDVHSRDGLSIPVHVRAGATIAGRAPLAFVQILGAFGKESPAPWDAKAQYLHRAGVTVLKIYVRGKAGFGRPLLEATGGTRGQIEDVRAVLEYAQNELHIPARRIVLFGHSDGALLAARVAATGVELGKLVVSSMLKLDEEPAAQRLLRCVDAFQGSDDRLAPERVPAELETILGPGASQPPCGSMTALPGEAHEIERAESWAKILGSIVQFGATDAQNASAR